MTSWEWRIQFVSAVLFCSLLLYFWPITTNLKGKKKNRHTKPSKYYITVSSWQLNASRQKIISNYTVSGAEKPPYGNPAPRLLAGECSSSLSRCPRTLRVIGKDSTWDHRHPSTAAHRFQLKEQLCRSSLTRRRPEQAGTERSKRRKNLWRRDFFASPPVALAKGGWAAFSWGKKGSNV